MTDARWIVDPGVLPDDWVDVGTPIEGDPVVMLSLDEFEVVGEGCDGG